MLQKAKCSIQNVPNRQLKLRVEYVALRNEDLRTESQRVYYYLSRRNIIT
jgi:hypothetical protein